MNLLAPFTGTLLMPDRGFLAAGSPVLLTDGRPVAAIRWYTWSSRFEVLDPAGAPLAECRPAGLFRRRFTVRMRDGRPVVDFRPGSWRPFNGAELILAGGQVLSVRQMSMWSDRRFEFHSDEGLVGRILPTTGTLSFRPDSYALELLLPAMSALQAIALAQAVRVAVRGLRQQRGAASG